ncbi:MAG: DNA translocase FtsK 4TM domain-containing protein [Deltaproteobacteria bacterium]|nr:DNA translocase FtsK 4TM domain-containing protein [Deltaproteobacteria bacterium]
MTTMEKGSTLNREILGVVVLVFALLVSLSLFSYNPADRSWNTPSGSLQTRNWGGIVGAYLADLLLQGFGGAAYLLCLFLFVVAYNLFRDSLAGIPWTKASGYALFLWSAAVLMSLVREAEVGAKAGGLLGDFSKDLLISLFSRVGAYLIVLAAFLLGLMSVTQKSLLTLLENTQKLAGKSAKQSVALLESWSKKWRERREKAENTKKERKEYVPPPIVLREEAAKEEPPKKAKKKPAPAQAQLDFPEITGEGYVLPSLALLDSPDGEHVKIDKETLEANSLILQKKLADFGVEGEVVAVRPGPVITMYEFKPAPGVKVRRIVTLADDLSMALRALSIRILAPIPGESVVGIEIPNQRREKVFLKQVFEGDAYQNAESKLTLALGKDISGAPFLADLARMPHLLVAGATGTGKSVSINAMVLSILFKSRPQDVQFIMIDPKMLELTIYENLPHMIVPVVTDAKKAAAALFWAMDEMDRRYRLMRDKGARSVDHYNRILEKETADRRKIIELKQSEQPGPAQEINGDGEEKTPLVHERLPRIVIVVDELADLMMSVGRDIEEYITRLAQKARAAGIHMILATQRPSVDVITGLIKANFPARVSFQVTSRVDSRTILDSIGAERLLGDGDMLFLPPGTARLTRVHGAFVSDQEIRKVVEFINQQAKPRYRPEVFEAKKEIETGEVDDDYDEMYDLAVELVTETQQASISMIQRRLRVGYNRAARMIEQMERDGVVGPADGAKPREVYARKLEQ